LLATASVLLAPPLIAQTVDVIRGRVAGPDNEPIAGALVTVNSVSGAASRQTRSDQRGRYTVTVPGGDGDYFVSFASIGYGARRIEVKRVADEDVLVVDARLTRATTNLEAVRVEITRRRATRADTTADLGGTERSINAAALASRDAGDLAAMAASLAGVLLIPGADGDPSGFSVLGLTADQNAITLNGQTFSGGAIPPDAAFAVSLVTSPYDVSRGGFSGGDLQLRTRPGTNYFANVASLSLDAPTLQWTDAGARANGQQYSSISPGGLVAGPIVHNQAFYSLAYQVGRRASHLQSLFNTDPLGLQVAGIASDSAQRLLSILRALGLPGTTTSAGEQLRDQGSILGSIDVAPASSAAGSAYNVTLNGSWSRQTPVSNSSTEFPSHSGERLAWYGGLQARHSTYFSFGILTETVASFSGADIKSTPFLQVPSGSVLIGSRLSDGSTGVKVVHFGGSPDLSSSFASRSLGVSNQLSWFSEQSFHRLKLTTELRREFYNLDQHSNQLGSFTFNSLAELANRQPSAFSRTLSARGQGGGEVLGAISLGDSWRLNEDVQLQYGVRMDANMFSSRPTLNATADSIFGARNDQTPNRVYFSPRFGFSWRYGTSAQIGAVEDAFRAPRAMVRGGVGVFQSVLSSQLLNPARENTGLPSGLRQIDCAGPAVPEPAWATYEGNTASIPTSCSDGSAGTVFASGAPNLVFFARDYVAPRSVRGNLQWTGAILNNRLRSQVEATYSLNLNQPGAVDLNFAPTSKFALANEAQRPVFAQPASIVSSTGTVAAAASRISPLFNRVLENRSDLNSKSAQLRVSLSPERPSSAANWSLTYVYSHYLEQARGFGTSTAGNPLQLEWARSNFDIHHQIQYSLSFNVADIFRLTWSGDFRSGMPFTPLILGDVNGDGYNNDRAFVFDANATQDTSLRTGMRALLGGASHDVRRCLERQLGALASRNSCEGPWTSSANVAITFNPLTVRLPQRATVSVAIYNPLGAADLLLNGDRQLRGWGQPATPDPYLLVVRGFNANNLQYRYDVNQRFGGTRPAVTTMRAPVTATIVVRVDLGPPRERQLLMQQLYLGRKREGEKLTEPFLRLIYRFGGLLNPLPPLLRQADTLALSNQQADSLASLNRWYNIQLESIWAPLATYLAGLPERFSEEEAYDRYQKAREMTVDVLLRLGPDIKGLLTAQQFRRLPPAIVSYLDPRFLSRIRSSTAGPK
jgi:hypothetical protein